VRSEIPISSLYGAKSPRTQISAPALHASCFNSSRSDSELCPPESIRLFTCRFSGFMISTSGASSLSVCETNTQRERRRCPWRRPEALRLPCGWLTGRSFPPVDSKICPGPVVGPAKRAHLARRLKGGKSKIRGLALRHVAPARGAEVGDRDELRLERFYFTNDFRGQVVKSR